MSTEPNFTPGPWRVFICDDGKQWSGWPLSISAENEEDKVIVRTGGQWPYEWDAKTSQHEACANAHLIAAAPDMIDALKAVRSFLADIGHEDTPRWPTFQQICAAIAKAQGTK